MGEAQAAAPNQRQRHPMQVPQVVARPMLPRALAGRVMGRPPVARAMARPPAARVTEQPPAPQAMGRPPATLAGLGQPRVQLRRAIVQPRVIPGEGGPQPPPPEVILRLPAALEDQGQLPAALERVDQPSPVGRMVGQPSLAGLAVVPLAGQQARVASGAAPLPGGVQSTQPRAVTRSARAPTVLAVTCTSPDGTWIFIMD